MGIGLIACRICGKRAHSVFIGKVRSHIHATYNTCDSCGFLETGEPYWLDASYKDPVDPTDTGIFQKNLKFGKVNAVLLFFLFNHHDRFRDFAGRYGVLSRLVRDIAFDFTWHDKYVKNLFCRGFEYDIGVSLPIELITCFETFEHFADPLVVMTTMTSILRNILFTTHLLPTPLPEPDTWWYYQLQTELHVSFYHRRTLEWFADHFSLLLCTNGRNIHFLTEKRRSQSGFNMLIRLSGLGLHRLVQARMKSRIAEDAEAVSRLLDQKKRVKP